MPHTQAPTFRPVRVVCHLMYANHLLALLFTAAATTAATARERERLKKQVRSTRSFRLMQEGKTLCV